MPTIRDLFNHYRKIHAPKQQPATQKEYLRLWQKHILPALGDKEATELTRLHCVQLYHSMGKHPVQANRTIAALRAAFNLAEEWELVPQNSNPVKVKLEPEEARDRYPSNEEGRKLFDALDSFPKRVFANYIWLLVYTGARPGELLMAKWDWISTQGLRLPVAKRKKKGRMITLSQAAQQFLDKMPKDSEYLLPGLQTGYPRKTHVLWHKLLALAGVKHLQMRDLRRYFASLTLSEKTPLDQVGQLLGHSSTQTTRRYAYLQEDARLEGADAAANKIKRIRKG